MGFFRRNLSLFIKISYNHISLFDGNVKRKLCLLLSTMRIKIPLKMNSQSRVLFFGGVGGGVIYCFNVWIIKERLIKKPIVDNCLFWCFEVELY